MENIMSIFGIEKNENVWSNIYAFFFDSNNCHNLDCVFFDSLIELIQSKTKFEVTKRERNVNAYREVSIGPNNDGRIDLLLFAEDVAIIIENKVYHSLENDVNAYFDEIGSYKYKFGVIISLKPVYTWHKEFVNITHAELMEKVWQGVKEMPCESFYKTIIEQFYSNINKMSGLNVHNGEIFINQKNEIIKHSRILEDVKNWFHNLFYGADFVKAINECANGINLKIVHNERESAKYRYTHLSINNSNILFNIYFEPLWNPGYKVEYFPDKHQSIFLTLEIEDLKNVQIKNPRIVEQLKDVVYNSYCEIYLSPLSCGWWHFACLEIPVSNEELFNQKVIVDKILSRCGSLFDIFKRIRI